MIHDVTSKAVVRAKDLRSGGVASGMVIAIVAGWSAASYIGPLAVKLTMKVLFASPCHTSVGSIVNSRAIWSGP